MPRPIRVLLIDDSSSIRELSRILLEEDERLEVLGESEDVSKALELLDELEVDVIMLDYSLPNIGGLEAIPILRDKAPQAAILLYTGHAFSGLEREAMERGAQGLIEKGARGAELAEAVHRVAAARTPPS